MTHESPLFHTLRRTPAIAFELVSRVRKLPSVQPNSITQWRSHLSVLDRGGTRRSIQPALTLLGRSEAAQASPSRWAVLVDVLGPGPFDLEQAWIWPHVNAVLRHELGVPTHLLVVGAPEQLASVEATFTWEPELQPILVDSLDADSLALPRAAHA